jgi:uncharacterized membrane protein
MSEQPVKKTETGLEENVAGLLCYLVGWITGIIFLILEKKNQTIRFHAWQSTIVFGAYTILSIVFGFIPFVGVILNAILGAVAVILWVILMFKAYKGERYKLPVAGEIAEKQVKKETPK